jgi:hypothetical protein
MYTGYTEGQKVVWNSEVCPDLALNSTQKGLPSQPPRALGSTSQLEHTSPRPQTSQEFCYDHPRHRSSHVSTLQDTNSSAPDKHRSWTLLSSRPLSSSEHTTDNSKRPLWEGCQKDSTSYAKKTTRRESHNKRTREEIQKLRPAPPSDNSTTTQPQKPEYHQAYERRR